MSTCIAHIVARRKFEMEYNTNKIYITSYYQPGSICIQLSDNKIHFRNLPLHVPKCKILVEIFSYDDKNVFQKIFSDKECSEGVELSLENDGVYFLRIFIQNGKKGFGDTYKGLLFKSDVPFYYSPRGNYRFIETIVASPNRDFLKGMPSESKIDCNHERTKIKQLAKTITQSTQGTYNKILAIHDWVAENIFYDYDALNDLSNKEKCVTDPVGVLQCRRSVCQGYCDLTVSLLKSIGIPAVGIVCYALGMGSVGGWDRRENVIAESNHIFPAAFCDSRWLLMDVTWDSDNEYKNGVFSKSNSPVSRKYFDVTTRFLSNTHKLISLQN